MTTADRYKVVETDDHRYVVKDRMTGKILSKPIPTYCEAWAFISSISVNNR